MEYLLLLGACAFFALQFVFQKLFETRARSGFAVCLWNILVSGAVAVLFLLLKSGLPSAMRPEAAGIAALYAAAGLVCSVASISAMNCGPVSGVGIYCLAGGMILPFLYGVFALGEGADLLKCLGMGVLTLSLVPAVTGGGAEKKAGTSGGVRYVLWCAVIFLTNGLVSIFSKMHQISPYAADEDSFVMAGSLIRCGAALLLLLVSAAARKRSGEGGLRAAFCEIGREPMTGRRFGLLMAFAAAYSVMNTLGNLLSLRCMNRMDASVQFPLLSAAVTVLTALFGAAFFRERIRAATWLSLALTVLGAALILASPLLAAAGIG